MKTAGIICEYNPFHLGHAAHIETTRRILGEDTAIICVMSGNFVQRGDFAVFSKHARAKAAVLSGADLVVEIPTPYALSSAGRFAVAGVQILDSLRICEYISFGSESGDLEALMEAADVIVSAQAKDIAKEWLAKGAPYSAAWQKAADAVLGSGSELFLSPNNLLGIEYLKAISVLGSKLRPITVKRVGAAHDSSAGCSAAAVRSMLWETMREGGSQRATISEEAPCGNWDTREPYSYDPWEYVPRAAAGIFKEEIDAGCGPVSMIACELAIMSRLREIDDYSKFAGVSEGLEFRFARYAASEPTVDAVLSKIKTKRYSMSRLRRLLVCACLGITVGDTLEPPPYIRVLAMNQTGMKLLKEAYKKTRTPIIIKPASARKIPGRVGEIFRKEAAATDFFSLAYPRESNRTGGQEWRGSPFVV